jgi:protoporphyrinogen/coproporphyrinogen III oxidase
MQVYLQDVMGKKYKTIILGAGISGLSCAHFLAKENVDLLLLEKAKSPGGWLQTDVLENFLFEKGPRTFRTVSAGALHELIQELGLEKQLIFSDPHAKKRYLWMDQQLQAFPPSKWELLRALLKEWRIPPEKEKEETIDEFATRRFGKRLAESIFDPLTLGIYAGDPRALSMNACFPKLKEWEIAYGSLTRAFFAEKRKKAPSRKAPLFSFQGGIQTLPRALGKELESRIRYDQEVIAIEGVDDSIKVTTQRGVYHTEQLISALPAHALASLMQPHSKEIAELLKGIKCQTLHLVNLGFCKKYSLHKGFGYLVPSKENEEIYGAVFDSMLFPAHNHKEEETRLTVMVKEGRNPLITALEAVKKHLGILAFPSFTRVTTAKEAIPQYEIGHHSKIKALQEKVSSLLPGCHLIGNYLSGVSVSDCVVRAKEAAETLLQTLKVSMR